MKPAEAIRGFFSSITSNGLSLAGTTIATASVAISLTLVAIEIIGTHESPYIGIVAYLVLPAIFILGLLLIPLGVWLAGRRRRAAAERGDEVPTLPVLDLNSGRTRNRVLIFGVLTVVNVMILATATYKGVEVMDSTEFCGATCHTVMQPEYTAYQHSPHSRVKCVSCHIGPGANWFVKSKLSGAWQVVAVAFDLYPRPIPTPVHALRPARDTCEQCHWPTKFHGEQLEVLTHYEEDEENTPLKTVLLLRIGGLQGRKAEGIHWHVDPDIRVRYRSDPSREEIYEVELTREDGSVTTFLAPGQQANGDAAEGGQAQAETGEWRTMDCVDCHNRPTHIYQMPGDAVDEAIGEGRIPRDLPYVKREAVKALQVEYASQEEARQGIPEAIAAFYRESYPELADGRAEAIGNTGRVLSGIYTDNVFPAMNVRWGTYPTHIGHENFPGCFRCHTDEHESADGQVISQDCDTCHSLLAFAEENPKVLEDLQP